MNETLGQRIRRLRKERSLSQTDLGKLVGVTISWISTVEQDRAMPSAELLSKIADAYKIPIRELLQDEDQHMELASRLKIIEILLENAHSSDAESMIQELENHPELSEKDRISLTLNLSECRYQQSRNDEVLSILQPLVDSLEIKNYHDVYTLAWIRNKIGNAYTQMQDTCKCILQLQESVRCYYRPILSEN